jgi:hypothetical protein
MNTATNAQIEQTADRFARRVTARLSAGNDDLPYDISERLRAARMQALAQRKREAAPVRVAQAAPAVVRNGRTASLGWGSEGGNWWRALVSAVPLAALLVGLVVINASQDEYGTSEVAEVDAALLTDDLPPSAYADPGFAQYLKTVGSTAAH